VTADLADAAPRPWHRLLTETAFGRFFLGRTLSSAGVWVHNVTAAVLAFELTRSAFVVGLVSVAQFVPQLVLAPLSGAMADRGSRKRQVIAGRIVVAAGSGLFGLWLWLTDTSDQVQTVLLLCSALTVGIGFVTGGPAMHAMVATLVRPNEIASAVSLNTAPITLARSLGPVIGTSIALALSPAAAFGVAALSNLAFAALLVRMDVPPRRVKAGEDHSVRAGVVYVVRERAVLYLLLGVAAIGIGADPAITLAPSISASLGHGSSYTGTFASAFGIGSGVAFLLIPLLRRFLGQAGYGTLGLLLMGVGLVVCVLPWLTVWWAAAGFVVGGLGMTLALTSLTAQMQEILPDDVRGRVMAFWSMGFLGSRPLAAALDGAVADLVSVEAALLLVALLLVAAAWLCSPRVLARAAARGLPSAGSADSTSSSSTEAHPPADRPGTDDERTA